MILFVCFVVPVYYSLAVEVKWKTTSSELIGGGSSRHLNALLTCLFLLYTAKYQKIPYLVAFVDCNM